MEPPWRVIEECAEGLTDATIELPRAPVPIALDHLAGAKQNSGFGPGSGAHEPPACSQWVAPTWHE